MRLRIREKFIGILILAAIVPLCAAVLAIGLIGQRTFVNSQGAGFRTSAEYLARSLGLSLGKQIRDLEDLSVMSGLGDHWQSVTSDLPDWKELEVRWPSLSEEAPEVRRVTDNLLALELRRFQAFHQLFAEIILTDASGRLVAATGKTSDYFQGDETWWQHTRSLPPNTVWMQGVQFDQSARVYSLTVSVPFHEGGGVIKGVINASPLFAGLEPLTEGLAGKAILCDEDGNVIYRFGETSQTPLANKLDRSIHLLAQRESSGWKLLKPDSGPAQFVGHARVMPLDARQEKVAVEGFKGLGLVVQANASAVLAPVRRQLFLLSAIGAILVLSLIVSGFYVATHKIISPITTLQRVAEKVEASAGSKRASRAGALALLRELEGIRTRDEIEELAKAVASMARRVLGYHDRLEREILSKTAEIRKDLQFAREFQTSLMPTRYPLLEFGENGKRLSLRFHHIYRPASSVGGDYFDVIRISDHSAAIFIADVMGHGARSALVTAILATLVQDFHESANSPAEFLRLINAHFHEVMRGCEDVLFVTACHLVIDLQRGRAVWASAGHPSPILANRASGTAQPLFSSLHDNPALGLFPESIYEEAKRPLRQGDIFVLFTDGITEASNPANEEFGREGVLRAIHENLHLPVPAMNHAIVESMTEFRGEAPNPDDICLVAVEVSTTGATIVTAPAPGNA